MNRWWARRSSAVFRAILIGLLDENPNADVRNLYANSNTKYPQASEQVILDPFMGGGTTVVEALRVGFRTIGVDLNPLASFIVKNECTAVDLDNLDAAFERIRKEVQPKIAALYSTTCPNCQLPSDVVHAFWSKVAHCATCSEQVEIRRERIIGKRRGLVAIRGFGVECSECGHEYDAEIDRASVTYSHDSKMGENWSTIFGSKTRCPKCKYVSNIDIRNRDTVVKKIDLYAVQCPKCNECSTVRGPVPVMVKCNHCKYQYESVMSNTERGIFRCSQGHKTSISNASRRSRAPLDFKMYAIEGVCKHCKTRRDVFAAKSGFRFFKAPNRQDIDLYDKATRAWRRNRNNLPWPRGMITDYEKTNRLIVHNYSHWYQLFNERQLLSLGWILQGIRQERDLALREALTSAFLGTIEHQNMLNSYYLPYAQSAGAFGRHDFHPKVNACEGNPWGATKGRGTFRLSYEAVRDGKEYTAMPFDSDYQSGSRKIIPTGEKFSSRAVSNFGQILKGDGGLFLRTADSRKLSFIPTGSVDHVVTDPPYADAVQYSELADFFYVWLREALGDVYPKMFGAEETPKTAELVENISRGHSQFDFHEGLAEVFRECHRVLKKDGRLIFTFHHSRRSQWEDLLKVIVGSGFNLIASYPVASEGTRSGNLVFHTNRSSVAYDIVHVCAKRLDGRPSTVVAWEEARESVEVNVKIAIGKILHGQDHGQRIETADIAIMVWSEVLQLYSKHQDNVVSDSGHRLSISEALDDSEFLIANCENYSAEIKGSISDEVSATSGLKADERLMPSNLIVK